MIFCRSKFQAEAVMQESGSGAARERGLRLGRLVPRAFGPACWILALRWLACCRYSARYVRLSRAFSDQSEMLAFFTEGDSRFRRAQVSAPQTIAL
jgi:hypothetical protein